MRDKTLASAAEAVAGIEDGSVVAIVGFGVAHRFPNDLIDALVRTRAKDLTLVSNSLGRMGGTLSPLIERRRVRKLIVSLSSRAGDARSSAETQIAAGELAIELVPQGTLVERMRAAGAGLAGFYTRTGVGTAIAEGKEVRHFGGRPHLFERALPVDHAFVRAFRADRAGNLQFRGGSRTFSPSFAKAARTTIAEVDEVVDVGGISPERVGLPGVFVSGVVRTTAAVDLDALAAANRLRRRPPDAPREYRGKRGLTRSDMAARAARLLPDGGYVNLGVGIPALVADHIAGRDITLHSENGILGYGGAVQGPDIDPDNYIVGGTFVALRPGASFFDSVTSFEMARGGKLDAIVLGGYQVDQDGSLANWSIPSIAGGAIGGAMDLVAAGSRLIVLMEHCATADGAPKLVRRCTYPVTGSGCVDTVVTDLALLRRVDGAFVLEEVAPGFTVDEILALTAMDVRVAHEVRVLRGAAG